MGLSINASKTNFMVFSRKIHLDASLQLNGQQTEMVDNFKYLESIITVQVYPEEEVKQRLAMAQATFTKM